MFSLEKLSAREVTIFPEKKVFNILLKIPKTNTNFDLKFVFVKPIFKMFAAHLGLMERKIMIR